MSGEITISGGIDTRATTYGFARDLETVKAHLDGSITVSGGIDTAAINAGFARDLAEV
jgi:hypothetical protein